MVKLRSTLLLITLAATPLCAADEKLDTAPIISALIDLTDDPDAKVRYAALDALRRQPQTEQFLELFWRGCEDDSTRVRLLSLNKIVELEGPTDRVLTRLILLQEQTRGVANLAVAEAAQKHLISFGTLAIPYLIEALKKNEANQAAIAALGKIPLGEAQAAVAAQLTALLKSDNKDVRLAAVQSLQSIMVAEANRKANAQAFPDTGAIDPRYLAYYTKLLQKYDSNADGSLTVDEWIAMSKDPAAADTDQDGKITAVELAKWAMRR